MAVIQKHIGKTIRSLRKKQNLTLVKVAGLCKFSPSLLSQIETGNVNASLSALKSIAIPGSACEGSNSPSPLASNMKAAPFRLTGSNAPTRRDPEFAESADPKRGEVLSPNAETVSDISNLPVWSATNV